MRRKLSDLLQRLWSERWGQWLAARRNRGVLALGVLLLIGSFPAAVIIGSAPLREAGPVVSLTSAGRSSVSVQIIYPAFVGPHHVGAAAAPITIMARADNDQTSAVTLIVALPDDSLAFVDRSGSHVSGRVVLTPGFPEWQPHDLWLAHGHTRSASGLLTNRRIELTPAIVTAAGVTTLPELAFSVTIESPAGQLIRRLSKAWALILPVLTISAILLLFGLSRWRRRQKRLRLEQERMLAGHYAQLRSHIKLERWGAARNEIEAIQTVRPEYRDLNHLEVMVSAAETATWRREQLYATGLEAYRQRQWPVAAQAFGAIEQENPYYRETRFLMRTSKLYADLASRDRSLRVQAAQQLGCIGDLVDMAPLIDALGDRNRQVAQAAEEALLQVGPRAADDLIGALRHKNMAVRPRAFHLLQQMGQEVHDHLLAGLHSADPTVTQGVARLLAHLGARHELAKALLWLDPQHHESIRLALADEHVGAVQPLVDVLLGAPPERRQGVINVLGALLAQEDVRMRVEDLLRGERDVRHRALLQRALKAADRESSTASSEERESEGTDSLPSTAIRWLRRLDKGQ